MLSGVKIIPKGDEGEASQDNERHHHHHHRHRHRHEHEHGHGHEGRQEKEKEKEKGEGKEELKDGDERHKAQETQQDHERTVNVLQLRRDGWMVGPELSTRQNTSTAHAKMKMPEGNAFNAWKRSSSAGASQGVAKCHIEKQIEPEAHIPDETRVREGQGDQGDQGDNQFNPDLKKPSSSFADALERARSRNAGTKTTQPLTTQTQSRVATLPLIQADGKPVPGAFGRETAGQKEINVKKRVERYDGGQRVRYYADDDSTDLSALVRKTKYQGVTDIDATMAANIVRNTRFRASDVQDADAEYDEDVGLELVDEGRRSSKKARKTGQTVEEAVRRDKQRQAREFAKYMSITDRCEYCVMSPARQKHLTVAVGTASYLALPPRGRLCPGHCQIVAAEHIPSTRVADELTWTEIRNFKKCLLQMFTAQGKECIFLENFIKNSSTSHAFVDCIPLEPGLFASAPTYFRKAFEDATSDWAQHAAKNCITTGGTKGLRESIPPNFPYFYVEFGLRSGMLHVIDDVESFDRQFGRRVMVGLMRLPDEMMHRRATKESDSLQRQWVEEFRKQFDSYDWTRELQA